MELIRVVIIDDDAIIREGMALSIPWESLGYKVVGDADNGSTGLEVIKSTQPDMVLLDIKMPQMDGLEVSSWLHKRLPDVKILMLSAHSDFEYARHAIKMNVIDYIIKPIYKPDFVKVLERLRLQIQKEQENKNQRKLGRQGYLDELMLKIIHGGEVEEAIKLIKQVPIFESADIHQPTIALFEGGESLSQNLHEAIKTMPIELMEKTILFQLKENVIGTLFEWVGEVRSRIKIECMRKHLAEISQLNLKAGIGQHQQLKQLNIAYRQAYIAMRHGFYSSEKETLFYKDTMVYQVTYTYPYELEERLYQSMTHGNEEDYKALIEIIFRTFYETGLIQQKVIINTCIALLVNIERRLMGDHHHAFEGLDNESFAADELLAIRTLEEVKAYVVHAIQAIVHYTRDDDKKSEKKIIKMSIEFMKKEYHSATLSSVAEAMFVSPNHLSFLFKMEREETFIDVLTKIRMNQAKKLLKKGHLKMYEIAEQVGYKDARHFSKVFKKYTGVSPKDY